jgi:hypothetical protein
VQIPAEYGEREVTKLVKPASTVTKVVPVNYEREIMTMVQPATEKRIPIPAEYAEREVNKLVSPAKEVRVPIPAEYADVPQEVLVCPAQEYWTQLLCDENTTPAKVTEIQKALAAAGFNPGPANGDLNEATMKAVSDFQKAKSLPQDGFLNMETVQIGRAFFMALFALTSDGRSWPKSRVPPFVKGGEGGFLQGWRGLKPGQIPLARSPLSPEGASKRGRQPHDRCQRDIHTLCARCLSLGVQRFPE